ncbi:MAG: alpha-L-fucosidase, partial [bacterium]
AFREKGFGIGCYFSKPDWHSPDFWDQDKVKHDRFPDYDITQDPARWQRFVAFTHRQFEELMADYGAIDMLWLDGGWIRKSEYDIDIPGVAKMARSHHPELLMVDRACGGLFENIITPEQMHDMPAKPYGHPWEICVTMAHSWGYVGGEEQKPARTLIHLLIEVVAKDGNLLLNVGPRADGTFPPEAEYRLCAIGDWMRVNAEAIHGTRAIQPYQEGDIRYTRKGSVVYAIILSSDEQSPMPKTVRIEQLPPAADNPVFLLGCDEPLQIIRDGSAAVVVLPPAAPCRHAWTLRYQNNETMECV